MPGAMFCNHANESPQFDPHTNRCNCKEDCYCKVEGMCRPKSKFERCHVQIINPQGVTTQVSFREFIEGIFELVKEKI